MMKRVLLLSILFLNFVFSSVFSMDETPTAKVGYFTSEFLKNFCVQENGTRSLIIKINKQSPYCFKNLKDYLTILDKEYDLIKNKVFISELMLAFLKIMGISYKHLNKWPSSFTVRMVQKGTTGDGMEKNLFFLKKINNLYVKIRNFILLVRNGFRCEQALILVKKLPFLLEEQDINFIVSLAKAGITTEKCIYLIEQKKDEILEYCQALDALGEDLNLSVLMKCLKITIPNTEKYAAVPATSNATNVIIKRNIH